MLINDSGQFVIAEYDTRLEGWEISAVPVGQSVHYYSFTHDSFFNGVEIYNNATAMGIKVSMYSEYYVQQLTQWKRYKKFAKDYCLVPGGIQKSLLFPTTPGVGVRIKLVIDNNSGSQFDMFLNLFKFAALETVDPTLLQEGEDW